MTQSKLPESSNYLPKRIVSGGQTGVDRAGLDAAIALGIEHGGWCPRGRLSEDGSVPSRYLLEETRSAEYPVRTEQNVIDSDATVILYRGKLKGGTLLTQRICRRTQKPHVVIRLGEDDEQVMRKWLRDRKPEVLNVAGPRESTCPGIYTVAFEYLMSVFANV